MPLTVTLSEKKVSVVEKTKTVLDCLDAAVQAHFQDAAEAGNPLVGPQEEAPGVLARYILRPSEVMSDVSRGGHYRILRAVNFTLDPPAESLWRGYLNTLNQALLAQGYSAKHTVEPLIESKHVLLREILLRLSGYAVSAEANGRYYGEKMLKTLRQFVDSIASKDLFSEKPILSYRKATPFMLKHIKEYPDWEDCILGMVHAIGVLHQNDKAVSNVLTQLRGAEATIEAQLIVYLDSNQDPDMLSDQWAKSTLGEIESKLIEKSINQNALSAVKKWIPNESPGLTDAELHIVATQYKDNDEIAEQKVKQLLKLYSLRRDTLNLYEMMTNVDLLMRCTGWMPFLLNIISLPDLAALIENHGNACKQILAPKAVVSDLLETEAGYGLLKYKAINGSALRSLASANIRSLAELNDPVTKRLIGGMITMAVSSLIMKQRNFPRYRFINEEQIERNRKSLLADTPMTTTLELTLQSATDAARRTITDQEAQLSETLAENRTLILEKERLQKELENEKEQVIKYQNENDLLLKELEKLRADNEELILQKETYQNAIAIKTDEAEYTGIYWGEALQELQNLRKQSTTIQEKSDEIQRKDEELRKTNQALMALESIEPEGSLYKRAYTFALLNELARGCKNLEVLRSYVRVGASLHGRFTMQNAYCEYTALHIAARTGNVEACRFILDEGGQNVDVNIFDGQSETPLDKAAKANQILTIRFLQGRGGVSKNIDRRTNALQRLITRDDIAESNEATPDTIVNDAEELLKTGADVNATCNLSGVWMGLTPLHILFMKGNQPLIKLLMKSGADPSLTSGTLEKNQPKQTPLEMLRSSNVPHKERTLAFLANRFPAQFGLMVANAPVAGANMLKFRNTQQNQPAAPPPGNMEKPRQ